MRNIIDVSSEQASIPGPGRDNAVVHDIAGREEIIEQVNLLNTFNVSSLRS